MQELVMSGNSSQSPSFLEMFTQAADSSAGSKSAPSEALSSDVDADERWLRHVEIEQAKGTLTALFGIDPDDAFAVLSAQSQSRNIKVHALARIILDTLRTNVGKPEFVQSAHRSLDRLLG
ncbi:hypothetical protein GCM10007304_37220 [Rhodococcoides trifolii]|uniref:ANTAR domain-containing protein n=1 Tax=Rhodococcoides trifolii TaxID=908250 RepID=A0A917G2S6_9NOCA|nr:ANTAR domain-containing protein [Rhodococcus trifolii]GGG19884.1 hypothetical protein GCM10007304_37220 [Rhodococcus trifolii]